MQFVPLSQSHGAQVPSIISRRAGPLYFVALTLCAFYNNMFHQIPRGGLSSHLETTLVGILSLEHAA